LHKSNVKCRVSFLLGFAVWCIGSHVGAQTAYGPGGLFIHPTAFTPPKGTVSLSVSRFAIKDDDGTDHWLPVSLTFSPSDKTQIGGLFVTEDGASEGLFGKAELTADSPTRPAFGIAGSFLTGSKEQSSIA
jgi:hypothetical protein